MTKRSISFLMATVIAVVALGVFPSAQTPPSANMTVVAFTDYDGDNDYYYCFKQRPKSNLYFTVVADDVTANTVEFNLWELNDPATPVFVESGTASLYSGKGKITIKADHQPPHLGQGPYVASFTATTAGAASARKQVGSYAYYYDTWREKPHECRYQH